jgi:hypothetical protein
MTCRHLQFTATLLILTLSLVSQSLASWQEEGDSNIHLPLSNEVDSGVFEAALSAEVLRYFNRERRLERRAEAYAVRYTEAASRQQHSDIYTL